MLLGERLVANGLVSREDVAAALENQRQNGGRLGDNLVAMGKLAESDLLRALNSVPPAPLTIEDTGLGLTDLLNLVTKALHTGAADTAARLAEVLRLPQRLVQRLVEEATSLKLIETLGVVSGLTGAQPRIGLSARGREWSQQAFEQNGYVGPAPVPLAQFVSRIQQQAIGDERVSPDSVARSVANLVVTDDLIGKVGPALNAGRPMLLYGPPGNGKTSVAERIGAIFASTIYVPHCFEVAGQIVKVYDPDIHKEIPTTEAQSSSLRATGFDRRWVACRRPFVVTGGELTLEMLDLSFNPLAKFYEAPLHVKALNGTFLIDDFGRQRAKPEDILNRWIVPLNSRVDYLTLHSGKSIRLPFDEIVIFSTNLHPNDLMDPAFQRRIPYKLETVEPPEELFRRVFTDMAKKRGLELTDDIYRIVIDGVRQNQAPLAYFQPKFIVEQVLASCKFEGAKPQFTADNVKDALANLFVRTESKMFGVARAAE